MDNGTRLYYNTTKYTSYMSTLPSHSNLDSISARVQSPVWLFYSLPMDAAGAQQGTVAVGWRPGPRAPTCKQLTSVQVDANVTRRASEVKYYLDFLVCEIIAGENTSDQ